MRNIFLIKLSNIIIKNYQIIQYCSKVEKNEYLNIQGLDGTCWSKLCRLVLHLV